MEPVGTSLAPEWVDEIDAAPGPPFLRMGTRALTDAWLLGGPDVPEQLTEKQRILAALHHEAFAALEGSEDAGRELLELVRAELAATPAPPPGLHPVDAAGRLVAEDLCLLERRGGSWVLTAGSVCFPSHWRLRDKLGLPVTGIHGPVPHYRSELADRVDRFLDRLRVGPGVWRRNWTVHTSPQLFAPSPPPPPDPPVTRDDAGNRLWFRSERQTLRRLPESNAIVFGIRTQQTPLAALAARSDLCARLAETAAAWSPAFLAYRGGEEIRRPFLAWLRQAAAA